MAMTKKEMLAKLQALTEEACISAELDMILLNVKYNTDRFIKLTNIIKSVCGDDVKVNPHYNWGSLAYLMGVLMQLQYNPKKCRQLQEKLKIDPVLYNRFREALGNTTYWSVKENRLVKAKKPNFTELRIILPRLAESMGMCCTEQDLQDCSLANWKKDEAYAQSKLSNASVKAVSNFNTKKVSQKSRNI